MGCGCGGQQAGSGEQRTVAPQEASAHEMGQRLAVAHRRTQLVASSHDLPFEREGRAAMCDACGACVRGAERPAHWPAKARLAVCGVDRQPVIVHVTILGRGGCPLGRHADREGLVTWAGVRWYGVPKPLRWRMALVRGIVRDYPGCGCIVVAKDSAAGRALGGVLERTFGVMDRVIRRVGTSWHARFEVVQLHERDGGGLLRVEKADWSPVEAPLRGVVAWAGLVVMAVACLVGACL